MVGVREGSGVRVGVVIAVGDGVSVDNDRVTVGEAGAMSVVRRLGVHAPRIKVRKRSVQTSFLIRLR